MKEKNEKEERLKAAEELEAIADKLKSLMDMGVDMVLTQED